MKKSEAMNVICKRVREAFGQTELFGPAVELAAGWIVVDLASEAGVQWDPELPRRLSVGSGGSIVDRDRPGVLASSHIHREAAARYNAVERFLTYVLEAAEPYQESLRQFLTEERSRLEEEPCRKE